jgi:hypothetical protein
VFFRFSVVYNPVFSSIYWLATSGYLAFKKSEQESLAEDMWLQKTITIYEVTYALLKKPVQKNLHFN